jgi:hypothetical protein
MAKKLASVRDNSPINAFLSSPPATKTTVAEPPQQDVDIQVDQPTDTQTKPKEDVPFKRATFYLRPDQITRIYDLVYEIKKLEKVKTNQSALVRLAIDNFLNQDLATIANQVQENSQ